MVNLRIGTNTDRKQVVVDESKTPKELLEEADIDFSVGSVHLDGATLNAADMNKSLSALGVSTAASPIVVVKGDAA